MSGVILLAFGLWMLLTMDVSWLNVGIGLMAAVMVSWLPKYKFSAVQLLLFILLTLLRLPQAVWEALLVVFLSHPYEHIARETLIDTDTPWAVFRQVFLITFTPKTLVISDVDDQGQVYRHTLERKAP
jgi:multicomponent Na+:H+ antiporter subunit E